MLLSAKILKNIFGVNAFSYGTGWTIRADEPNSLYFQLVDKDQADLRYMPAALATLNVTFPALPGDSAIVVAATQPFAQDSSIWKVDLTNLQVPGSGAVVFALTEGATTRTFSVQNAISVEYPGQDGSC